MEGDKKKSWDVRKPRKNELDEQSALEEIRKRKEELRKIQSQLYERTKRPRYGINLRVDVSTIELLDQLAYTLRLEKRTIIARALQIFAHGKKLEQPSEEWYESTYRSKKPPYAAPEK